MELAEVKKYFENVEFVETTTFKEKRKVNLKSLWIDEEGDIWCTEKETGYKFFIWNTRDGFAKILTTKEPSFSITKDQLRQLTDPKIKEWFPEVFELPKDFTGWVKTKGELNKKWICYFENGFQKYGVDSNENWFIQNIEVRLNGNEFEVAEQEVFEALKNEAVKRGYAKGNFKCIEGWNSDNFGEFHLDRVGKLISAPFREGGKVLFYKGTWATITPTITKSEAEKLLNKKIID